MPSDVRWRLCPTDKVPTTPRGYAPDKGAALRLFGAAEGQRPSAHQTAEPLTFTPLARRGRGGRREYPQITPITQIEKEYDQLSLALGRLWCLALEEFCDLADLCGIEAALLCQFERPQAEEFINLQSFGRQLWISFR